MLFVLGLSLLPNGRNLCCTQGTHHLLLANGLITCLYCCRRVANREAAHRVRQRRRLEFGAMQTKVPGHP